MNTPPYIHGLHDPGGEHLMGARPGWIVFTEAIGADPSDHTGRNYRQWSDRGFGVIVRLNHGYGADGTLPHPNRYGDFAGRVANFVTASRGCERWIIGNEPNHAQEWPNGLRIGPQDYAACFRAVWVALRSRAIEGDLIPAAIAPWNVQAGDWRVYQSDILSLVGDLAGGITLHTYTHGPRVELVTSNARMQPPYQDRHFEFRAYQDLLVVVPERLRHLPVYITETDQGEPWLDHNNGWVQAAYLEIDRWNQTPGTQKIHCLCLYRWPDYDQWGIVGKPQVQAAFRQAVDIGYRVPVATGALLPIPVPSARQWDPRLTERGVKIMEAAVPMAHPVYWGVVRGVWLDEQQSGGRHHIFVDVLDEQGGRVVGVKLRVHWPSGSQVITTEAKPGEPYAVNFPLSPSRNEFEIAIVDSLPSDMVTGIGMGADTPGGFNAGIHTSTVLVFQRATLGAPQTAPKGVPPLGADTPHVIHLPTTPNDGAPLTAETPGATGGAQPDAWDDAPDSTWQRSIAFVLGQEGGLSTDPDDPGNYVNGVFVGTKFGISAAAHPGLDIVNLTVEQAREIYRTQYWQASHADQMPWPLCLAHFDLAVNGGVGRAQEALGEAGHDFIGYMAWRIDWYTSLPQFDLYGRAWIRRCADLLMEATRRQHD